MYGLVASGKALATEFDDSPYPHAGLATAQSTVPVTTTPQSALADLRAVLDGYLKSGIPADLVEAAKAREVADLEFKGNSIEGLAFEWSQALAVEHRHALADDVDAIRKVGAADVNRVMRRYIVQSTATVAIAVPKNAGAAKGEPERHTENNTIIAEDARAAAVVGEPSSRELDRAAADDEPHLVQTRERHDARRTAGVGRAHGRRRGPDPLEPAAGSARAPRGHHRHLRAVAAVRHGDLRPHRVSNPARRDLRLGRHGDAVRARRPLAGLRSRRPVTGRRRVASVVPERRVRVGQGTHAR